MATWSEILAAFALLLGLFTRFWSITLLILTTVAITAVHWPDSWNSLSELWQGYAISDDGHGNFKLPLLFMLMLFPLLFMGAGKFSVDALLRLKTVGRVPQAVADKAAIGLPLMAIGVPLVFVMPKTGLVLAIVGAVLVAIEFWQSRSARA